MRNRSWRFVTLVLILLVVGGLFIYLPSTVSNTSTTQVQRGGTISITIPNVYLNQEIAIKPNETALALLERIDKEVPKLQLATKEYAGMGTLVEAMGGLRNGTDDKYWSYYVNGQMAQVGAGAYLLKDTDKVEWKFAKFEQ